MTAEEVQALIDAVPCDLCYMSPGMAQYAALAAMIDIANGEPVPATTQELVAEANCLICMVSPGLVPYLMIQALRNISSGSGVTGCPAPAAGNPEGVVTADPGCTYLNLTDSSFWVKRTGSGNTGWEALIV